jgi:hypothetical protein
VWPSAAVRLPRHASFRRAWQIERIEYGAGSDQVLYRGAQPSIGPAFERLSNGPPQDRLPLRFLLVYCLLVCLLPGWQMSRHTMSAR